MAFSILNWALGTTLNAALGKLVKRSWHQRLDSRFRNTVSGWLGTLPQNVTLEPSVFFFPREDNAHDGRAQIQERIVQERRLPADAEWYEALRQHSDYLVSNYGKANLQSFFQQSDEVLCEQLKDLAVRLSSTCQEFPELFNRKLIKDMEEVIQLCEEIRTLDPTKTLLRAISSISSAFRIDIQVERILRYRDIVACGPTVRCFTLGDCIRLTIESPRNVNVCLFDIGTSGRITVLLPNRFARKAGVPGGGRLVLPTEGASYPDLALVGVSGVERLVALGTAVSMPVAELISPEQVFLLDPDPSVVRNVVDQFASLREEERGIGYAEFLVVPA